MTPTKVQALRHVAWHRFLAVLKHAFRSLASLHGHQQAQESEVPYSSSPHSTAPFSASQKSPAAELSKPGPGTERGPGRALGRGSRKPRGRGRARPHPSPVAASSYNQDSGGSRSRARRLGSGSRKDSSSRSPLGRGPRCSRCSCSRARRYMASSFSRRALRALGLPGSPSGPQPLALGFVPAPWDSGVAVASVGSPLLPSPGNRKAWRKRLRFSRFSRRFSSRSRAFSSSSRAFCRSRSSRVLRASKWLAARSANRSSSCRRAPPARPRQPTPQLPLLPPPRARPGRPCPFLAPPLPEPPQLPCLVAPPRMRHIGPVPTSPPASQRRGTTRSSAS